MSKSSESLRSSSRSEVKGLHSCHSVCRHHEQENLPQKQYVKPENLNRGEWQREVDIRFNQSSFFVDTLGRDHYPHK